MESFSVIETNIENIYFFDLVMKDSIFFSFLPKMLVLLHWQQNGSGAGNASRPTNLIWTEISRQPFDGIKRLQMI